MTDLDRRSFLKRGGMLAGAALASTTALSRIDAHAAWAKGGPPHKGADRGRGRGSNGKDQGGYGELSRRTAANEPAGPAYLAIPAGFSYVVLGKLGSPMADGTLTPRNLDGMGAFARPDGSVRLIRNHENRNVPGDPSLGVMVPLGDLSKKYDPLAYGGTTTLDVDIDAMRLVRDFVSSAGTTVNCAGGLMLGGAGWFTCEETVAGPATTFRGTTTRLSQKHGYNFAVPVTAQGATFPQPLRAMGRFAHEAVATDPRTGIVYETEDAGNESGFYRFLPANPTDLAAGGRLQMLGIVGIDRYDTTTGQTVGRELPVRWIDIPDPDPDLEGGARKARFDEQANIAWARALEVGIHVYGLVGLKTHCKIALVVRQEADGIVYGLVGLKTHCKIALVVRQEADGIRRYCHVGTGNYNEKTARLYEDLGLLSADRALGADLSDLFNLLTGYSRRTDYRRIVLAPTSLRDRIVECIRAEAEAGDRGRVVLKLNALADAAVIDALYEASQAGVSIDLIVRGICCLRPGVPGLSENIRVRSIVGRYLEHSRILQFGRTDDGGGTLFIGSADLMPRNLDRRIEAVVAVDQPALRKRLLEILELNLADNTQAWQLSADDSWSRVTGDAEPVDAQRRLYELAQARARRRRDDLAQAPADPGGGRLLAPVDASGRGSR